jgi:mannose-6-phosphate isomerase-like protein (cupin superfamily)
MSDIGAKTANPRYAIEDRELVAETDGLRVQVLTLGPGESIPWHWHSQVTDTMVCLEGAIEVETRAPRESFRLAPGGRCTVPPKRAHIVRNVDAGRSRFLIVQGVGTYDFNPIG